MQSILEMQRSLGGVENAVKNLESATKGHGDKLDQIGKDVHAAKVTMGVVGAIIVGAAALIGWIVTTYISAHPH
jgi:F0F1-type ATP synthase assembly protein I